MSQPPSERYSDPIADLYEDCLSAGAVVGSKNTAPKIIDDKINKNSNQQKEELGVPIDIPTKNLVFPPLSKDQYDDQQRHYIRFYINMDEESRLVEQLQRDGQTLQNVDQTDQNRFRNGQISEERFNNGAAVIAGTSALGTNTIQQVIGALSKSKGTLSALGAGVAAVSVGGAAGYAVSKIFNVTKKMKRLNGTITLYAPGEISTTYGIKYDQHAYGMMHELLKTDKGSEIVEGEGFWKTSASAASKVGRILGTAASKELLGGATRTAINKKKDLLFDSVDHRSFNFGYTFAPRNASEALEVADIITTFVYHAHPELLKGFDQFLYLYPAEFDIEYFYKRGDTESQNDFIRKISSCVITGINIQYGNGGSYQSLANGEPVMTRLNLSFMEIETLTKERIQKGL